MEKYAPIAAKKGFSTPQSNATTTPSGLTYKIVQKGTIKPIDGYFYFHYAGYFEDGSILTVAMKT
jgi:FKBP-type peptidyl-prolyl cis-trans isomerase